MRSKYYNWLIIKMLQFKRKKAKCAANFIASFIAFSLKKIEK